MSLFTPRFSHGQTESSEALMGSCLDREKGMLHLELDLSHICEYSPGNLRGLPLLGLGSMVFDHHDEYLAYKKWDDPGTPFAVNNGKDIFTLSLASSSYFGISIDQIDYLQLVFHSVPNEQGDTWGDSARDPRMGSGECPDDCTPLILKIAEVPTCSGQKALSDSPLRISIAPNPVSAHTFISVQNPQQEITSTALLDLNGTVMRQWSPLPQTPIKLLKGELKNAYYFFVCYDASGKVLEQVRIRVL